MTDTLTVEQIGAIEALLTEAGSGWYSGEGKLDPAIAVIAAVMNAAPALIAMARQTHDAFRIALHHQDRAEKAESERDIARAFGNSAVEDMTAMRLDRDRYRDMAVRLAPIAKRAWTMMAESSPIS